MTKKEAQQIPDLCIEVTEMVEDAFYIKMAIDGAISENAGNEAARRMHNNYKDEQEIMDALTTADRMIDNLHEYGVACAAWCE